MVATQGKLWTRTRLALAFAVSFAVTGGGIAALADDDPIWEQVSYYSTFGGKTPGLVTERGAGSWDTGMPPDSNFVSVSGVEGNWALDLASYNGWTDSGQTVLAAEDAAFTIALRAKTGTEAKGVLFAFGSRVSAPATGGLSIRRGDNPGEWVVATGMNVARLTYTPETASDDAYVTFAVIYENGALRALTLDGGTVTPSDPVTPDDPVIAPLFQFGSRHGNGFDGEVRGCGAIDALGVWKRVLTAEDLGRLATEWATPATIPSPARGEVAFDTEVPEAWGPEKPSEAAQIVSGYGPSLSLEPMTRNVPYTVNGRTAIVGDVHMGTAGFDVYGVSGMHFGDGSEIVRDVWLKVSGGTYGRVVGGKNNDWRNGHANSITGNLLTELGTGVVADHVIGGIEGCGTGGDASRGEGYPLTGDTLVTIDQGATVRGNIVGGDVVYHGDAFTHTGDSTVRIRSLQGQGGAATLNNRLYGNHVIGGQASADASNRSGTHAVTLDGDSAVEIMLDSAASGPFVKEIIGGSYNANDDQTDYAFTTTGNATVTIEAPTAVTFSGRICAGSRGNATVQGKVTLTLTGGTYTGDLVPAYDGATATGGSELVVDGADLSKARLGAFDKLTLCSAVDLGANRLPEGVIESVVYPTLTLTLTDGEIADRRAILCRADAVPTNLTFFVTNPQDGWDWRVVEGRLCYAPEPSDWTWQGSWEGFQSGDNLIFPQNEAQGTANVDTDRRASAIVVAGDWRVTTTGNLSARTLTVNAGATFVVAPPRFDPCRYLKLVFLRRVAAGEGVNNSSGWALSEIGLWKEGAQVAWPEGMTIASDATNADHPVTCLADGSLGINEKWYWESTAERFDDETCAITFDAGEGNVFDFDAYNLATADQNGRNPIEWELWGSPDGSDYTLLDKRVFSQAQGAGWATGSWLADGPFALGEAGLTVTSDATVAGTLAGAVSIEGDLAFKEGSTLAIDDLGGGPTVAGNASGTVALDVDDALLGADTYLRVITAPEGLTLIAPEGYVTYWKEGSYWLIKDLAAPASVTLSGDATWAEADWKDAAGNAVAPAQWDTWTTAMSRAEITAGVDATLATSPEILWVGALTIGASKHTLTLAGDPLTVREALTVNGKLATNPTTLPLPAQTTIGAGATLAYDVPEGATAALQGLAGEGIFVKSGAGTLRLDTDNFATAIEVREGIVQTIRPFEQAMDITIGNGARLVVDSNWLPGYNSNFPNEGNRFLLEDGATLELANGSYEPRRFAGRITVKGNVTLLGSVYGDNLSVAADIAGTGTLILGEGGCGGWHNTYAISGSLADGEGGKIALVMEDWSRITLSGDNTHTGGTTIRLNGDYTGSTQSGDIDCHPRLIAAHAEALGTGPVAVGANTMLEVAKDTVLNVHAAFANANDNTAIGDDAGKYACGVKGAIRLCAGATLTQGTAVFDALEVADGAVIPVTPAETIAAGDRLVQWTAGQGPADTAVFSVEGWQTEIREDGLYAVVPLPAYTFAVSGGVPPTEAQREALVAFAQANGLSAGEVPVTLAEGTTLDALDVFDNILSVKEGTVALDYDFGIADIAVSGDTAAVTVALGGAATFRDGVTVALRRVEADGSAAAGKAPEVTETVFDAGRQTATLTFALPPGERTVLFRAVATPATP